MASTQERDELRRLADELPDDAVHNVLQVARVASPSEDDNSAVSFVLDGIEYKIDFDSMDAEQVRERLLEFIQAVGRLRRGGGPMRETTKSGEAGQSRNAPRSRERPAWIGAGHLGPDFASRAKDVLRDEMGQRNA